MFKYFNEIKIEVLFEFCKMLVDNFLLLLEEGKDLKGKHLGRKHHSFISDASLRK